MQKSQLITIDGQVIDVLDLDVSKISIQSIARRLSKICRFGGEIEEFYSVAQHAYNVSKLGLFLWEQQAGLMHENGECFMGDLATPIKYLPELSGYRTLEKQINKLLLLAFTGNSVFPSSLKLHDSAILYLECKHFHPFLYKKLQLSEYEAYVKVLRDLNVSDSETSELYIEKVFNLNFKPLPPKEAEKLFLDRYAELFNDNS